MLGPNVVLSIPSIFGADHAGLVEAIRREHGRVAIYVSINEREPILYIEHERRAIAGLEALQAVYEYRPAS